MSNQLPEPDAIAAEHSERLLKLIRDEIEIAGGWLPFTDYMRLALYAPGLGYYSAGSAKFGSEGDFITAPEISPLFSRCLAGQVAEVLNQCRGNTIIELGAGSGALAVDLLLELKRLDSLPEKYLILEPSADLRIRQQHFVRDNAPDFLDRLKWLDGLPAESLTGVVIANEVLDALPVALFELHRSGHQELGVVDDSGSLAFAARPVQGELAVFCEKLVAVQEMPDGYRSEVGFAVDGLVKSVADVLTAGAAIFIDYGLSANDFYIPERSQGTLRCHYRHHVHNDPLVFPGIQDVTAWVDFTRVAEAALAGGLSVAGYTNQAQFLLHAGLDEQFEWAASGTEVEQAKLAAQVRKLTLPGEMGEVFKVMLLVTEDVDATSCFDGRDLRVSL